MVGVFIYGQIDSSKKKSVVILISPTSGGYQLVFFYVCDFSFLFLFSRELHVASVILREENDVVCMRGETSAACLRFNSMLFKEF